MFCMDRLSFNQYRAIDLGIMAVLLFVFEMITATAAIKWFPGEFYTFSPTITIVCIVMMRWGGFAALHAVVGGLAFCIASGASAAQFVMYCAGNCLALLAQLGRWFLGLFFGGGLGSVVVFFTTDSLSLVFALVVVLIARRLDGLFEDQKEYLIRTEDERFRERNKNYYE